MQLREVRPFFSDKYNITRHKQYHMLSDDDPGQEFNIEKYVSDQRAMRLKLPKGKRFTEYAVDMTAVNQEVTNSEVTDENEIYVGYGSDC